MEDMASIGVWIWRRLSTRFFAALTEGNAIAADYRFAANLIFPCASPRQSGLVSLLLELPT